MSLDFPIELDARSDVPLHRQLSDGVRAAIVEGRVTAGMRLPSTRALAEALGISRSTITASFAELHSEGYLRANAGAGTYVSSDLPEEILRLKAQRSRRRGSAAIALSSYGASVVQAGPLEPPRVPGTIDFRDGRPAFDAFPFVQWRRCVAQSMDGDDGWLDYRPDPAGDPGLREAIAAYLGRGRAIRATAADVIIVNGSQQAIDILARVLIEPGDIVAIEEPGYPGAQRTFAAQGADVRAIAVDADGIRVDLLAREARARLVYVTPSHQFPLGVVLSTERRRELLRWAQSTEAVVIEDDYDSAYRYIGRPIPALYGMDGGGRVVYVGTFSKTMFPGLRIGYLVVPPALRDVVLAAKAFSDRQSPILEQRALAAFIREGGFERHLRRMRVLYAARRAALLASLQRHIGAGVEVIGDRAGMHVVVRLAGGRDDDYVERARSAGVILMTTDAHRLHGRVRGEFIFGFAEHPQSAIDEGVRRLSRELR